MILALKKLDLLPYFDTVVKGLTAKLELERAKTLAESLFAYISIPNETTTLSDLLDLLNALATKHVENVTSVLMKQF